MEKFELSNKVIRFAQELSDDVLALVFVYRDGEVEENGHIQVGIDFRSVVDPRDLGPMLKEFGESIQDPENVHLIRPEVQEDNVIGFPER